jgi:succinate dehydrogenase / fumarate reductase flavoprotein subunit
MVGYLELENMLLVAETIAVGAIAREESRGSHFRTDFPKRDDSRFLKHTIVKLSDGKMDLSYAPVRLGRFPVKERTY